MSKYRIKQIIDGNGDSWFYPQRKVGMIWVEAESWLHILGFYGTEETKYISMVGAEKHLDRWYTYMENKKKNEQYKKTAKRSKKVVVHEYVPKISGE